MRRDTVKIEFADVSYFWGQMGAGKTSIVRLVDYCLGGNIQLTPAMQNEFEGATLELILAGGTLLIERPRDADRVIATWSEDGSDYQLTLPARKAEGEVLPGTDVENLSDLLFRFSGIKPPKVRKSKLKEDSDSARLSIRDLLWYCYLDQDEIDSSFFYLDEDAPFYMRNKSRDVLRYVVGFHDEHVAELEAQLDQLRGERQALNATIGDLPAYWRTQESSRSTRFRPVSPTFAHAPPISAIRSTVPARWPTAKDRRRTLQTLCVSRRAHSARNSRASMSNAQVFLKHGNVTSDIFTRSKP